MNQGSVPAQIGPYPVERLLAQGGMGAVYVGRHPELGYEVAIKVLLAGRGASDDQRARFRREVAVLAKLEHPGLVTVLGEGEEQGAPWFAMRRVEGSSLADRLHREGPLPLGEVAELANQLCAALSVAHEAGILHRDLKPANVLCTPSGQFVVTDFGLAKDLEVSESVRLSRTGVVQGTPGFWSPEQAAGSGGSATPATDVYGLGATLYAALTGRPPVEGNTWVEVLVATRETPPTPPRALRAEVPDWLERVVLRCLEKRPEDRYPSMSALRAALEHDGHTRMTKGGTRTVALVAGLVVIALSLVVSLAWPRDVDEVAEPLQSAPPEAKAQTPAQAEPTADHVRQVRGNLRRDPSAPDTLRKAREMLAGPGGSKLVDLRLTYLKASLKNGPSLVSKEPDLPARGLARWFDDERVVVSSRSARGLWRWNDYREDAWERVGFTSGGLPRGAAPAVFGGQVFVGGGESSARAVLCYSWDATTPTRRFAAATTVTSIAAWGPKGSRQLLAVGTMGKGELERGRIHVFDLQSGEELATLRGHRRGVNIKPRGSSGDTKPGELDLNFTQEPPAVRALLFSRDGRWLISGGYAGDLIVWDVSSWTVHKTTDVTDGSIMDLALHPTRPLIAASTGPAREVQVLRIPGLEVEQKLTAHSRGFSTGVSFSRDGKILFAVSGESGKTPTARAGELLVHDLQTKQPVGKLTFRDQGLSSVDVSPDGRRLLTYSRGEGITGILQVWEIDVPPRD